MNVFNIDMRSRRTAILVVFIVLVLNEFRYTFLIHNRLQSFDLDDSFRQIQIQNQNQEKQKKQEQEVPLSSSSSRDDSEEPSIVNEIIHRAFFGLGHRLHRSASAYHLARDLNLSSKSRLHDAVTDRSFITHLRFHWESCLDTNGSKEENEEYNVFRYLFGGDVWKINHYDDGPGNNINSSRNNSSNNTNYRPGKRNMIIIRNDIPGYISGQVLKNLQIPIHKTPNNLRKLNEYNIILDKLMNSDVEFYRRLVSNYRFRSELRDFQHRHKWNERSLVLGLHLRAGNGEKAHFVESGRAASLMLYENGTSHDDDDEVVLTSRLVKLINMVINRFSKRRVQYQNQYQESNNNLPPLLFIATDTAHLIPLVKQSISTLYAMSKNNKESYNHTFINNTDSRNTNPAYHHGMLLRPEIITWPQYRLPKNSGVGFDALQGKGDSCLEGWKGSISDILLLSEVDVLLAAKRSTFTQSLPMTLGFGRNQNQNNENNWHDNENLDGTINNNSKQFSFCEISESDATRVTCATDVRSWLFRGEDNVEDGRNRTSNTSIWTSSIPTTSKLKNQQNNMEVAHKVTVLLPEIVKPDEFEQTRAFLRRENSNNDLSQSMLNAGNTREHIFRYGQTKIYKKYRNVHTPTSVSNSSWNIVCNNM